MKKLKCFFIIFGVLSVAAGIVAAWYHRDFLRSKIKAYFTAKDFTELPMNGE
ncbi:MAG: hypothetical protein U0M15_06005 [Bacillota bacterium]|nr:hypothetical protein [Bacillota bacterium]